MRVRAFCGKSNGEVSVMLDEASCRAHTITSKPARSIKPPKILDFWTQSLIMYSNTFAKFSASSCIFWGAHKQSWNIPAILRYWHQHRAWTFTTQSCSHDVARMETDSKMLIIVTMPSENTYTCHAMSMLSGMFRYCIMLHSIWLHSIWWKVKRLFLWRTQPYITSVLL